MSTPMKRTKGNTNNLKILLVDEFSVQEIQQRAARTINDYNYETPTFLKEIISDFKFIFHSFENKNIGFSITYDFLEKDIENQTVQISMTNENYSKNSIFMNSNDFNTLLKELNKNIKRFQSQNNGDSLTNFVLKEIEDKFIKEEFNMENAINQVENTLTNFLDKKNKELGLKEIKSAQEQEGTYIKESEDKIKEIIESSDDFIELEKIKSRMAVLEERIATDKSTLEHDYFLPSTKDSFRTRKHTIELKEREIEKGTNDILKNTNSIVRSKIKKKRM